MPSMGGEHLSVARALYQLDFYLDALNLPFTVVDLYERAYKDVRGDHYDDRWVRCLHENPEVVKAADEPFTTHSIIDTLLRTGHEPMVRALMKEVRKRNIGFTQAYMIGMPRRR
jgi:hypothetical protein